MKRGLAALVLCGLAFGAASAENRDARLAGKWVTDSLWFQESRGSGIRVSQRALIMELKLDKQKALKGKVMDIATERTFNVENARVDGTAFTFSTFEKVDKAKVETIYKGDLAGENLIRLSLTRPAGGASYMNLDGTPVIVFHRAK